MMSNAIDSANSNRIEVETTFEAETYPFTKNDAPEGPDMYVGAFWRVVFGKRLGDLIIS